MVTMLTKAHLVCDVATVVMLVSILVCTVRFAVICNKRLKAQAKRQDYVVSIIESHQGMLRSAGERLRIVEAAIDGRRAQ